MKIKLFVGFQYVSDYYSKIEIEHYVDSAVNQINKELKKRFPSKEIILFYQIVDIDSGKNILNYISDLILESDICAFELSDRNTNVMFELGIAHALGKKIIYLVNEEIDLTVMPSDLDGKYFRQYNKKNLKIIIGDELNRKTYEVMREKEETKSIFDLEGERKVNIVCPEIPVQYRMSYAQKLSKDYLHLARFGDPDTLNFVSKHITRLYPTIEIGEYIPSETPQNLHSYVLISIGGPGWNSLTRDLLQTHNIPLEYGDYSEGVEDFYLKNLQTGRTYRSEFSRDNRIIKDIGVFVKLPNALSSRKPLYMINGIQTYGVLGTARSLIENEFKHKNMQKISDLIQGKSEYYLIVFELPIVEGHVYPAEFLPEDFMIFLPKERKFISP